MKDILYVIQKFPCESEYFILNEILELEKRNYKIHILALKKPHQKLVRQIAYNSRSSVLYLPTSFILFAPFFFIRNVKKNIQSIRSIYHFPFNLKKLLKLCYHLSIAQYFKSKVKEFNIKHIHAHFAFIATDLAQLISQLLNVNYSFTAHAQDIYLNTVSIRDKIKKASFVVTCTKYNLLFLNDLTGNKFAHKIHLIYHGIDLNLSAIEPDKKEAFTQGMIKIITVARLVEKKGIIYLLKAIEILVEKKIKVKCTIIGDGPLRDGLQRYIAKKKLKYYVEFKGTQPRDTVIQLISLSDIFVLPCIQAKNGDRDGLPNVLLEAMLTGTPVISTSFSAIPELIENIEQGILVPEKNEVAIADAIMKLYSNQELYIEIRKQARSKVKESFNQIKFIDILEKEFGKFIN